MNGNLFNRFSKSILSTKMSGYGEIFQAYKILNGKPPKEPPKRSKRKAEKLNALSEDSDKLVKLNGESSKDGKSKRKAEKHEAASEDTDRHMKFNGEPSVELLKKDKRAEKCEVLSEDAGRHVKSNREPSIEVVKKNKRAEKREVLSEDADRHVKSNREPSIEVKKNKRAEKQRVVSEESEFQVDLNITYDKPTKKKTKENEYNSSDYFKSEVVQIYAVPDMLLPTPSIFKKSNEEQYDEIPSSKSPLSLDKLKINYEFKKSNVRFANSLFLDGDTQNRRVETAGINHEDVLENRRAKKAEICQKNVIENEITNFTDHLAVEDEIKEKENIIHDSPKIISPKIDKVQKKRVVKIHPYPVPHKKSYVLHLKHPSCFSFIGKMKLTLLAGHIKIFGYSINSDSTVNTTDLYFPKFCTTPVIETCVPSDDLNPDLKSALLSSNLISEEDAGKLMSEMKPEDSIILVEEIMANFVNVFDKYFDKSLFSDFQFDLSLPEVQRSLQCAFNLKDLSNVKEFKINPEWDKLNLNKCNVICGGKNVGKSSLLRYLVNKTLMSSEYGAVVCLDFDPGQSEFTPPGCLSVVVLRKPVFGPNFTHVMEPEKMVFLGEVNVSQCPTKYLEAVRQIVQFYKEDPIISQMPCFVNSMGFCKGLGVALTVTAIKLLKPDTLIQITSSDNKNNYPFHLTPECLKSEEGFVFSMPEESDVTFDFQLIQSYAEEGGVTFQGGLKPRELRDLMLLSYFSQMITNQPNFNSVQPYSISFSKLHLAVDGALNQNDILKAFNGNMVALCVYKDDPCNEVLEAEENDYFKILVKPNVMPCLGLGFVRGIDCNTKKIYVITHLSSSVLESVNCLMIGAVTPPHSIYLKQETVDGPIAYTTINTGDNVQRVKRSYRFPKNHTP